METLFDDTERIDPGPAEYAEPTFPYWNRSARQDIARVRRELEQWFGKYPPEHCADLRARFRSPNDVQHRAGFFELFLHEMLLRLGGAVEVHPPIDGTTRRPEFRVHSPEDGDFYLEARVAGDESPEQAGRRVRINRIYDAINDLDSPDFWISVEPRTAPASLVRTSKLKGFLRKELARLDYDEMLQRYERGGLDELPRWSYESEGWSADLFPIPKQKARGEKGVRPMGMEFIPVHVVDTVTPLRNAILEKARSYGTPDLPFVIAINFVGEHIDDIDELSALFGDEEWLIKPKNGKAELRRKPNGVWTIREGQYRRVSGVMIFRQLRAWNFPATDVHLYHHPIAEKPVIGPLLRLPQKSVVNGQLETRTGESLSEVFGEARDWLVGLR